MYVCICKGITDTQIKAAVDDGCSSMRELRAELGVATNCCKCVRHARQVLGEQLAERPTTPLVGYFEPQAAC